MTDSKFENTKSLKFSYNHEGVVASYKKRKFIMGFTSILHEGVDFSDDDHLMHAQMVLNYHCEVRNKPLYPIDTNTPILSQPLKNDFTPFYKYVSNEVFENYISKGLFQLGTIEQYRTIENIKQRDEFEGHSFLNFSINNHVVSSICSSCFNYLIFCGTKTDNSMTHKEQFGEKKLYIQDVKVFAELICKKIRAKRYFIQNIQYNTLKLYVNKRKIKNPKIDVQNILTPEYFNLLTEHSLFPSLFVKPEAFKNENEVRIVFEMPKDIYKPLQFESMDLLSLIKC